MPVFFLWSYVYDHLRYIHSMLKERLTVRELFFIGKLPALALRYCPDLYHSCRHL